MYYSLRGTLIAADGRSAAVECGGVGYLCTVSAQTYSQLPEPGEEVLLYTHLSVREDAMELYGFSTQVERSCFRERDTDSERQVHVQVTEHVIHTRDTVPHA